jgi:predicted acylesterase/phospholipase RssA
MGADVVISVDVSWRGTAEVDPADIAIRPGVTRTRILDFSVKEQSIAAGEAAAIEAIPRIRARIAAAEQAKQNLAALAR